MAENPPVVTARVAQGRIIWRIFKELLAPYNIAWESRWNYEGWMLKGVEEKIWIEDEQAELFIAGLKFADGER